MSGQEAARNNSGGVVAFNGNFIGGGELLKIGGKPGGRAVNVGQADQNSGAGIAAWRATHVFDARDGTAGKQGANVDHFVGGDGGKDALQAASAGALLDDECNRQRPVNIGGRNFVKRGKKRGNAKTVADRSAGKIAG